MRDRARIWFPAGLLGSLLLMASAAGYDFQPPVEPGQPTALWGVMFEAALNRLRQAAEALPAGDSGREELRAVLDMYGQAGDGNGVQVAFEAGGRTRVTPRVGWENGRQRFAGALVVVSARDLEPIAVAHEGAHLRQHARAIDPERFGAARFDPFGESGRYWDELAAYWVSATAARALGQEYLMVQGPDGPVTLWTTGGGFDLTAFNALLTAPRERGGYGLSGVPPPAAARRFLGGGGGG